MNPDPYGRPPGPPDPSGYPPPGPPPPGYPQGPPKAPSRRPLFVIVAITLAMLLGGWLLNEREQQQQEEEVDRIAEEFCESMASTVQELAECDDS